MNWLLEMSGTTLFLFSTTDEYREKLQYCGYGYRQGTCCIYVGPCQ